MVKILIQRVDITTLPLDAIVNAAKPSLLGGGGVDGAIHRAAGIELLTECRNLNGCRTGEAEITRGYQLPAKHVIHTVGPIWQGGDQQEAQLLANCYAHCLELARQHQIRSIAFPAISCGVYGFPIKQACDIALHEIFAHADSEHFDTIILACFNAEIEQTLNQARLRFPSNATHLP